MNITYISACNDNCYSEDTEVLTSKGFKLFKDLSTDDRLATLNQEHNIEYHLPIKLHKKQWNGDLLRFYSPMGGIDLLVTPNHRMYVHSRYKKDKGDPWYFEEARGIFGKSRFFKKNSDWQRPDLRILDIAGRSISSKDWLEFLGYYLSEGSATVTKDSHYIVQIRQNHNSQHYEQMADSLRKVTAGKVNTKQKNRIIVNDKQLTLYLQKFGNKYNKHIPQDILNNASKEELFVLFESLMKGDGHYHDRGGNSYCTSSIKLRDNFQELLLKVGLSGSYKRAYKKGSVVKVFDREYIAKEDNWIISVRNCQHEPLLSRNERSKTIFSKEFYKGTVYCATVPNHTLFIRRNGYTVWCGNSGYAEAARNHIAALDSVGVTVNVVPISFEGYRSDLGSLGAKIQGMIGRNPEGKIQIVHATPQNYLKLKKSGVYNIGYCAWETDQLPLGWSNLINVMDEAWVPSSHNKKVLEDSGVDKPVYVMPHPFQLTEQDGKETSSLVANVNKDDFVFYSIFQWIERKNPVDLLLAYLTEFKPDEKVVLILKTYMSNPKNMSEAKKIKETIGEIKSKLYLKKYPKILLVSSLLSKQQIQILHNQGDCYISLARCEGFGIPLAEAMLAKNPVITTGYGGPVDFMQNQMLVDYQMTPVFGMPWSIYTGNMEWAQPNITQAKAFMRWAFENRKKAKQVGKEGYNHITEELSWNKIGLQMKNRLEEIEKELR